MPFTADDLIATRLEFGGVELKGGGLGHHIVARNLRAAAHVELGEWVKAEEDLTWVLTHDPHNQTATANLCACLSRQKRWTDLLTVVECGLKDATDTTRRQLLVSEAAALEELGDSQLAALSLRAAGDAALEEGGASEVTRRVLSGAALLRGQQIPVERVLYCEGEDDSVDVRFFRYGSRAETAQGWAAAVARLRSDCAAARHRRPDKQLQLEVAYLEGRKHLAIVELRAAA